jgi:hypothetical protein
VSVPSSELGPPLPPRSTRKLMCPPPRNQKGGTHSPSCEGVGESQFGRREKYPSTLSTLFLLLSHRENSIKKREIAIVTVLAENDSKTNLIFLFYPFSMCCGETPCLSVSNVLFTLSCNGPFGFHGDRGHTVYCSSSFPTKFQAKKNLIFKKRVKLTHLTGHPEVLAGAVARLKQI